MTRSGGAFWENKEVEKNKNISGLFIEFTKASTLHD